MKCWRQIPFSRFLLFFIAGIIGQSSGLIPFSWNTGLIFVAFLFLIGSFLPKVNRRYEYRFLFGAGLAFLLFASACFITKYSWEKSEWNLPTDNYFYKAMLTDDPVDKPKTRMCKVRIVAAEKDIHQAVSGKNAVIYIPADSLSQTIVAGDSLFFHSQLEAAPSYLKKQAVAATGFIRDKRWSLKKKSGSGYSAQIKALSVRRMLLYRLQMIIPDKQSYAIAAALVFGYRQELDESLVRSFRNTGAAHILAISGTHLTILFGMLSFLLSFIGNSRKGKRIKHLILFPLIWAFAFLTGFSPAVVRAALMLSLWGFGEAFAYPSFTLNTVAVAAFFMLLFNPLYLYDPGFQLSFLAVVAIVAINPFLVKLYESQNRIIRYIWNLSCVSVSAQAGVLPLSAYYFHQIPLLFLLTNLFLLPLAAVLLFLIPVSLLLHAWFGKISGLLFLLNKTLEYFISITKRLDRFSFGNINGLYLDFWDTAAWFSAIVLLALLLIKKRVAYAYLLILLISCCILLRL